MPIYFMWCMDHIHLTRFWSHVRAFVCKLCAVFWRNGTQNLRVRPNLSLWPRFLQTSKYSCSRWEWCLHVRPLRLWPHDCPDLGFFRVIDPKFWLIHTEVKHNLSHLTIAFGQDVGLVFPSGVNKFEISAYFRLFKAHIYHNHCGKLNLKWGNLSEDLLFCIVDI